MERTPIAAAVVWLCLAPLAMGGCAATLSPLQRHTVAFARATVLVTDSSAGAYRAVNSLHTQEQLALAIIDYDKSPAWNPTRYVTALLSNDQLAARTAMLDGLKHYAETLENLAAKGKGSDSDLDASAQRIGDSLQGLSTNVTTLFGNVPTLTDTQKNGVSTGLRGLADVLKARIVRRDLPAIIQKHDPDVAAICSVLDADIDVLRRQADRDYVTIEEAQDQYIRNPQNGLSAAERRIEIARLVAVVRAQGNNDDLLAGLQGALKDLAKTHAALARSARARNAASFQQLVSELSAEGQALATYDQSLTSATNTSLPGSGHE